MELNYEDGVHELRASQPCVAVAEHGRDVSVCCCVRVSSQAHEAGVETLEGCQGRGYAMGAVAEWAIAVRKLGCIPLRITW